MRTIAKGAEPNSLTRHRCSSHADYDNFADKQALREALVAEQRGLCCYCLSRIRADVGTMKIEHWHCRDNYPGEQLDYANLLGACMGGEGQSWQNQHCDTRKGNCNLSLNPADATHRVDEKLQFLGDGRVVSSDHTLDRELNCVLNLNAALLKNNRKATLDAFKGTIAKRGHLARSTVERLLREWNGESRGGDLYPFCQVIVYWLRKRLARA